MRPVLFHVGPYPVFSYGVFILAGMVPLFLLVAQLAREDGLKLEGTFPVGLGVLVGAVFGARLSHLIVEPGKWAPICASVHKVDF